MVHNGAALFSLIEWWRRRIWSVRLCATIFRRSPTTTFVALLLCWCWLASATHVACGNPSRKRQPGRTTFVNLFAHGCHFQRWSKFDKIITEAEFQFLKKAIARHGERVKWRHANDVVLFEGRYVYWRCGGVINRTDRRSMDNGGRPSQRVLKEMRKRFWPTTAFSLIPRCAYPESHTPKRTRWSISGNISA